MKNIEDRFRKKYSVAENGCWLWNANKMSDVLSIRDEYKRGGISRSALATKYGVSKSNIQAIVERRSWIHI